MSRNKPIVENLDFQERFISTTEFQIFKITCSRNRDNCKKKKNLTGCAKLKEKDSGEEWDASVNVN